MKEELKKELQELSPFLADLKHNTQKEPFGTPRLYFDTLTDNVLERAKNETAFAKAIPPQYNALQLFIRRSTNWLSRLMEPRMALSVCTFVLVIGAGWYVINQKPTKNLADTAAVTHEEVQNYIYQHFEDFEEEDILVAFVDVKTSKKDKNEATKLFVEPIESSEMIEEDNIKLKHPKSGLTQEELEEYLNEHIDEEDISN